MGLGPTEEPGKVLALEAIVEDTRWGCVRPRVPHRELGHCGSHGDLRTLEAPCSLQLWVSGSPSVSPVVAASFSRTGEGCQQSPRSWSGSQKPRCHLHGGAPPTGSCTLPRAECLQAGTPRSSQELGLSGTECARRHRGQLATCPRSGYLTPACCCPAPGPLEDRDGAPGDT